MEADNLINKYKILQFLRQMSTALVASTYAVFVMSKGLSLADLSVVAISFFVVLLLVELPTGLFADRYGRKKSLIVSAAIAAIAPLVYLWAQNVWQCMLAESMFAISCGFYNGALDAWIKHELQHIGKDITHLQTASAKGLQAVQVSLATGALTGGWLAAQNLAFPWIAGFAADLVFLAVVAVLMRENYRPSEVKPRWIEGAKTVAKSTPLKFVCALGFIQCAATAALSLYWQPFYLPAVADLSILGWLAFAIFGVNFAGAKIAEIFFRKSGAGRQEKELVLSQILTGAVIVLAAISPWFFVSLIFYLIHEGGRGVFFVTRQTYLQRAIKNENQRALIGSIGSFFEQAGSIVGYLACILLVRHWSIGSLWLVCGILAIAAPAILYRLRQTKDGQF